MRILIAEDDTPLQEIAAKVTTRRGFTPDVVSNGQEAVEQAKANEGKYDLCLMDIDMPIMNGIEAAKIIRRTVKYFPIMALTGSARDEEDYLMAGMDDFLENPILSETLIVKLMT